MNAPRRQQRAETGAAIPAAPQRAVFRLPRSAFLAVVFLALCLTPFVRQPALALLYLLPLAVVVFVVRAATIIDADAIVLRALVGQRRLPWSRTVSLSVDPRGRVRAVVDGGDGRVSAYRLRFVRARHLPLVARIGGLESPDSGATPGQ